MDVWTSSIAVLYETKDKPTISHEFHHYVSVAGLWSNKSQTADSGPNVESWLNQRVHSVTRQISGVPANAAKARSTHRVAELFQDQDTKS